VEEEKIRALLSMPILNAFTAIMDTAIDAIDERWTEQIVTPFGGELSVEDLALLYYPREGELDKFKSEVIGAFYERNAERPSAVLEDREMLFGPDYLSWMRSARTLQDHIYSAAGTSQRSVPIRIDGVPSRVRGGRYFIAKRELTVVCGSKIMTFVYREGRGSEEFVWDPTCREVVLRIWVRERAGSERELLPVREWGGPLAFPEFVQTASPRGRGLFRWDLDYPDVPGVVAEYRVRGGDQLRDIRHQPPPRTVRQ
jgi:hypothetical protein